MNRYFRITLLATLAASCSAGWSAKVCIDPGHGGSDPGAVGNSQQEKTNVLNTGLKFRDWLNADSNDGGGGGSWQVLMTRTTDVFVSLTARSDYANSNAVSRFMSIHNNACGCGASGTETFSHTTNGSLSNDLRDKIQSRSIQAWGLPNRGSKQANFSVLRETNMPATLAELGFIDSSTDSQYTGNSSHQNNMAKHHMYALQNHYGITAYTPGTGTLPTYVDDSPAASGNWITATFAADKYGSDYKYRSTEAVSDAATWSINVGTAGSYKIQAWWSAGTNRSPGAPYVLPNGATVSVNQQINGGKWNTLGTVSLATGIRDTKLSCWAASGYNVIADAVRYTP